MVLVDHSTQQLNVWSTFPPLNGLFSQVPGGSIEMSEILDGVMFNKDVTHTGMKRRIENPRLEKY